MALILIEHDQHPDIADIIGLYELEQEINQLGQQHHWPIFNIVNDFLNIISEIQTFLCNEESVQIVKKPEQSWRQLSNIIESALMHLLRTKGITIDNAACDANLLEAVLQDLIRPALAMHAGNIKQNYLHKNTIGLELLGSCDGCSYSVVTLTGHVSRIVSMHFPHILLLHIEKPKQE